MLAEHGQTGPPRQGGGESSRAAKPGRRFTLRAKSNPLHVPALRLAVPWLPVSLPAIALRWFGRVLVVTLASWLAGRLSLALPPLETHATFVWLPTGVAL